MSVNLYTNPEYPDFWLLYDDEISLLLTFGKDMGCAITECVGNANMKQRAHQLTHHQQWDLEQLHFDELESWYDIIIGYHDPNWQQETM